VRQYFPKATDFTTLSVNEIKNVEELLNNRPRAVLGFRTPLEMIWSMLRSGRGMSSISPCSAMAPNWPMRRSP